VELDLEGGFSFVSSKETVRQKPMKSKRDEKIKPCLHFHGGKLSSRFRGTRRDETKMWEEVPYLFTDFNNCHPLAPASLQVFGAIHRTLGRGVSKGGERLTIGVGYWGDQYTHQIYYLSMHIERRKRIGLSIHVKDQGS
jgi:hypothetical protein